MNTMMMILKRILRKTMMMILMRILRKTMMTILWRILHLTGRCSLAPPGSRLVHTEQLLESLKRIIFKNNKDDVQVEVDVLEEDKDDDKTC